MSDVKLFDHADVGISNEYLKNTCGFVFIIRTNVFEDNKYYNSLIPKVYKTVEFIFGGKPVFKFEYQSQFDQETDEAVKFWTNVVKTTETGIGQMVKYFMDEKDIPVDPHSALRTAIRKYEDSINPDPDLDR